MSTYWHLGLAICLGFVCHLKCSAQEPETLITARITTVTESDWKREMTESAKPDGLRERLHARTLVELAGLLTEDKVTLLSDGEERGFVTRWGRTADHQDVESKKTEKQVIGTEMRVERLSGDEDTQETRLRITLTHDLQPPQSQPMTYATAAVGAEREKRSVTAPRFERLRWSGEVVASPEERMIASFQSPQDAGTRIVVFLQGGAAASKAMPALSVRQTIYRVPETDMIEWMLKNSPDDAAVAHHLEDAVAAGKASIVSSACLLMQPGTRVEEQIGTEHWVPTELDQDFDHLYMLPVAFKPVLQGTLLDFNTSGPPDIKSDASTGAFNSTYAPRAPLAVKWPTSWLRAMDEKGTRSKALHGWMEWYDRFEEHRAGTVWFRSAAPHLVAMMPPPDQVWGTDRPERWLDVTVMQQPGWTAGPPVKASEQSARRMFIGIALDSAAAHALLAARKGAQNDDSALLRDLLARVKEGKARVMTCALAAHGIDRCAQTSARLHAYPTEMPSIPSAWSEMPVGTQLEIEGELVSLTQHLAPPARSEWKLARDMPEAIMWEPRFRTLSMITSAFALTTRGTHLLTAADVPAVMADADLPANETYLLFSHLDSSARASAIADRDFEIETLIFETSAQDAAAWQGVEGDALESFSEQQLKSGHAKLQSHALLRTQAAPHIKLAVIEEYASATEFDPPTPEAPFRMRPTALETLPVGLQFESELTADSDGKFSLKVKLQHSTAKPIEPGLEETLRISADEKAKYPGAKHELDEWTETLHLAPGKFHRLLPPTSSSSDQGTTRIAFVRVRPAQ